MFNTPSNGNCGQEIAKPFIDASERESGREGGASEGVNIAARKSVSNNNERNLYTALWSSVLSQFGR
jgi:hypothetical protein